MERAKIEKAEQTGKSSEEAVALHLCYRQIGISAIAAAARYQGSAKNQAYAPVDNRSDWHEAAAS